MSVTPDSVLRTSDWLSGGWPLFVHLDTPMIPHLDAGLLVRPPRKSHSEDASCTFRQHVGGVTKTRSGTDIFGSSGPLSLPTSTFRVNEDVLFVAMLAFRMGG